MLGDMTANNSSPEFFAKGRMGNISNSLSDLRDAQNMVKISQDQLTGAQERYNRAVASGSSDLPIAAAGLENARAVMAQTNSTLETSEINYREAARSAKEMGVDLKSVPLIGEANERSL